MTTKSTKATREEIASALGSELKEDPTKISSDRSGVFTIRKGYYRTPGRTPEQSFASQLEKLQEAGFIIKNIEYGNKYATFKGGEGVINNSHYWMKFSASKPETAPAHESRNRKGNP